MCYWKVSDSLQIIAMRIMKEVSNRMCVLIFARPLDSSNSSVCLCKTRDWAKVCIPQTLKTGILNTTQGGLCWRVSSERPARTRAQNCHTDCNCAHEKEDTVIRCRSSAETWHSVGQCLWQPAPKFQRAAVALEVRAAAVCRLPIVIQVCSPGASH